MMRKFSRFMLMLTLSGIFSVAQASELTPAQINFIVDNNDIHIFMPNHPVKSVAVSITQASDKNSGEERAEYDQQGFLSHYTGRFSLSPYTPAYMSMRIAITQISPEQWNIEQKLQVLMCIKQYLKL